jgi:Tol biopolymer transport system component
VRVWLALLATLPLLAVGSGATASTSAPPRNGLIAAQGADAIYIVDPRTDTASAVPKSAKLTDPAWSPDGTALAVTAWGAESADVYTMKPDGSGRTLVVRNASSPSWSPDGKRLVVVRDSCGSSTPCSGDEQGETSLTIVNVDGTDATELNPGRTDRSTYASNPEWSPDGKLIAFIDGAGSIALTTPEGERVPLTGAPIESQSMSWSPDSSKLAYDRFDAKSGDAVAVVLDRATGKETIFRGAQRGAEAPVWSPEGDQLVFESMDAGGPNTTPSCGEHFTSHLWLAAPDGSKARQLGKGYLTYGPASWARAVDPAPVLPPVTATPEKTTAPVPNTTDVPSTASPRTPAPLSGNATAKEPKASASPAGAISVRGVDGIYLVDPKTSKASKVTGTAEMSAPAWSPDARLLAVEKVEKGGSTSIYTIQPNGSHPQLVLSNASTPSWSADGNRVFALRNECKTGCSPEDDEANVLYAVNLDGSNIQRVDFEDADVYESRALAWPTDGSAIHFFDEDSLDGPGSFDSSAATWSPDGAELVFAGSPEPSEGSGERKTGLWIVSADGGKPRLLLSGASGRPSWVAS